MTRSAKRVLALLVLAVTAGCAVGPDYQTPQVATGQAFKAVAGLPAEPARTGDAAAGTDATAEAARQQNRGWVPVDGAANPLPANWWTMFDDPVLTRLMLGLNADNLTIAQAQAQYRRAQAALQQARSGFFPVVGSGASFSRSGREASGASGSNPGNEYSLNGSVSWEPDVWGRVQRTVEGSEAGLQASAADLAAVRLSLQSTLAQTYFRVRAADAELRFLANTVQSYERSLRMVQNRLAAGTVPQADVEVARNQLEGARARLIAQQRNRAQLENAVAVLLGQPPSAFTLETLDDLPEVPVVPVALPSTLLQRRPDVLAEERRTAQANADIGVAQAAWFPDLTLSAQGGLLSGQWAQWISAPATFWSLGPALALTIFDGGAREARLADARAAYDAQVAAYRQTVLEALQEVEDYLVGLRLLGEEAVVQRRALQAARESLRLTQNQFDAGLIDYLSVVQVETSAFDAERVALGLRLERLLASVQLVTALGGGWNGLDGEAPQTAPATGVQPAS